MSFYQFQEEDVFRFISGKGNSRKNGDEVILETCPYCHSKKDKWTFSINRKTGQFECKRASCGYHGNMITLSRDFNFSLGKEVDAYYRTADYSNKQYKKFKDAHRAVEVRSAAVTYMHSRGITEDIVQKFEITNLPDDDSIIVFPFKDETGALTFVKYRKADYVKGQTPGAKEWCEKNCKPILFGINHCDPTADDRLIFTEGQIDTLSVAMAGFKNVVSVPTGANGFTWIPYCFNFVNQFSKIIIMGDCENGKITLAEELSKRWPTKVRVCRQEDYKGCKDANEILQKHGAHVIRAAIENAEAPYNAHIKPLAKVEQVDIMRIPCIGTGMSELDKTLDGGFRIGQLAVLTGKRGEGKSTIASMWGARALQQNHNCFFYSGELPDFFFRNWLDCQVTGKAEHNQSDNDLLNAWYGDRAYIYDETTIEGDELESLLQTIEVAIVQNNCKFILLDNLMTAIDVDLSVDIYRSQSKFVGDLKGLAKKYNVFILLIAHPRKTSNAYLENDDISGSSNITDKADLVLTYSRPSKDDDQDDSHRRLCITKNRLTGKLRTSDNPIKLVYDTSGSRRVADSTKDFFNINFGWSKDADGFYHDDEEDNPF